MGATGLVRSQGCGRPWAYASAGWQLMPFLSEWEPPALYPSTQPWCCRSLAVCTQSLEDLGASLTPSPIPHTPTSLAWVPGLSWKGAELCDPGCYTARPDISRCLFLCLADPWASSRVQPYLPLVQIPPA